MTDSLPERIRRNRKLLGNPYAFLAGDGGFEAELPQSDSAVHHLSGEPTLGIETTALLGEKKRGDRFSRHELEAIARRLQRALWDRRSSLLPNRDVSPLDVVDPSMALTSLGFDVLEDPLLGDIEACGEIFGVAGVLDRDKSQVKISPRFPADLQRFTLAHELGHVVLHAGSGQHRDRGLDGSSTSGPSSPEETEANIFAAAFLMPAKQVRAEFERRFSAPPFVLNEETAFGLGDGPSPSTQRRNQAPANLCRRLAGVTHFHGTHFPSLAQHFQVSEAAMAIRLRKLGLVSG